MGNRAVITWTKDTDIQSSDDLGIYLHWNGGRDSVQAFLEYCKRKGYRSPDTDCYGYACLCKVIGNFFRDGLSLGIEKLSRLDCDNGDNGVYICKGWEIIGRRFEYSEQNHYPLEEMIQAIDERQPEGCRLPEAVPF